MLSLSSLTLYQTTNFRLFQTDRVDDNFKFDENDRKLSKRVENTVGKGEIASYEQFLLFPQCFQKACFPGASKGVIVWEWVKPVLHTIFFPRHWLPSYITVVETTDSSETGMNRIANDYHQSLERILAEPGIKPVTSHS